MKIHVNKVNQDRLYEEATDHVNYGENVTSRFQRYLLNALDTPTGFTAYLDHTVEHLGIDQTIIFIRALFGPRREKTCLRWFANNIGADQPAHPRSLISAFVIRFLERIICKLAAGQISIF